METEIVESTPLLDKKGLLVKEGWARYPYWKYNRSNIHSKFLRAKEWDYYAITNQLEGYTVALTISDLGYASIIALAYVDYKLMKVAQESRTIFFPIKQRKLPKSSSEECYITSTNSNLRISFIVKNGVTHLLFGAPNLRLPDGKVGITGKLELKRDTNKQSLNIATSWKTNRSAFYLNEKKNCIDVSGEIVRAHKVETIKPLSTFAVLDWGRGKWTYNNTWYWASASGLIENDHFGFNIGFGFSDRSPASENAIFYRGIIHKIGKVTIEMPSNFISKKWNFSDLEGRVKLSFHPLVNRHSNFNVALIKSTQNQVFGKFSGYVILDEGTTIKIKNLLGFAEKVTNRW